MMTCREASLGKLQLERALKLIQTRCVLLSLLTEQIHAALNVTQHRFCRQDARVLSTSMKLCFGPRRFTGHKISKKEM